MMTERKLRLYANLFFFIVFIPLIELLVPLDKWMELSPRFLLLLFIYLCASYLFFQLANIPRQFLHRHYLRGILLALGCLVSTFFFARFEASLFLNGHAVHPRHLVHTVWFLFLIVAGYGLTDNMLTEFYRQQMMKEQVAAERDRAELLLYRSQINPHFLFNTLNALYCLVVAKSEKTVAAFEKFIGIIKYVYGNANRDVVTVGEEMEYLNEYIDLQRLRLAPATHVETEIHAMTPELPVAPMLLLSFVENAFKYGSSATVDCHIIIRTIEHNGWLSLYVFNSYINARVKSSGQGIANTRRRLELIYGGHYRLQNGPKDGGYEVNLEIEL